MLQWESKVSQYERDFERVSATVRKEVIRFEVGMDYSLFINFFGMICRLNCTVLVWMLVYDKQH